MRAIVSRFPAARIKLGTPVFAMLAAAAMGVLSPKPLAAQDGHAVAAQEQSPDQHSAVAAKLETTRSRLRVRGDADAVELDARQAAMADVLATLATTFNFSYHSATDLDTEVNGSYTGSLARVLSRVLDGYDYVIRRGSSEFDVVILAKRGGEKLEKRGGEAVAVAPEPRPISRHGER
jgi:hypothetical protein